MSKNKNLILAVLVLIALAIIAFNVPAAPNNGRTTVSRIELRATDGTAIVRYTDGTAQCYERVGYPTTFHCIR